MRTVVVGLVQCFVLVGAVTGVIRPGAAEPGAVAGSVRLTGEAPPAKVLHPRVDHAVCGSEPRPSEALVLSASGGVRNAVVFIGHERMEGWRSPTTFQIDQ